MMLQILIFLERKLVAITIAELAITKVNQYNENKKPHYLIIILKTNNNK